MSSEQLEWGLCRLYIWEQPEARSFIFFVIDWVFNWFLRWFLWPILPQLFKEAACWQESPWERDPPWVGTGKVCDWASLSEVEELICLFPHFQMRGNKTPLFWKSHTGSRLWINTHHNNFYGYRLLLCATKVDPPNLEIRVDIRTEGFKDFSKGSSEMDVTQENRNMFCSSCTSHFNFSKR